MAQRTKSPCRAPGCKRASRTPYCDLHQELQKQLDARSWVGVERSRPKSKIYNTSRWQRLRKLILSRNPICQANDCNNLSSHVDHIVPMADGGEPYELENLQALCASCHSRKTLKENKKA